MKQLFAFLSIIVVNTHIFAQTDFCLPGARWVYYNPGSASPPELYHYLYVGDTLINGFPDVKVLKKERRIAWSPTQTEYHESNSYFRQSNDSILQLVDGEFKFMFDFNVQAGDTRIVNLDFGCSETQDTMLIDSVGTLNYQGEELTSYYFSLLLDDQLDSMDGIMEAYYVGGGNGMYVERIGLMADHPTDLFLSCVDGNTFVEYVPASFVCYTDDELAATYPDTCNLFLDAPVQEIARAEIISLQDRIQIQNAPNSTLHVYDILGKELFKERINSDNQTIDLNHLPNGILMVVVEIETGRLTKKVVKTGL
ncbi:MAG: T9SS type A sorting domain-containing protein [Flavobacteriales bacterium]|nr:T9SS type A sorting domain-containing protein [Flavobacteriales bacterium]